MQFLSVIPEQTESAAQDLAGIRSALSASYVAAVDPQQSGGFRVSRGRGRPRLRRYSAPTVDSARFSAPRPPRFMTSSITC